MKHEKKILLISGLVLLVMAGMRWNVAIAGWLYPLPFLLYTRKDYGQKSLWLVLTLGIFLQTAKIVSEPMYIFIALVSGIQAGFISWFIFYIIGKARKIYSETGVIVLFAVLVTLSEYFGAMTSVLGTWGMAANTQLENLHLLQAASVTGAYGISFLMMLTAAILESLLFHFIKQKLPAKPVLQTGGIVILLFLILGIYSSIRLDSQIGGKQLKVAGVSAKQYNIMDVLQTDVARNGNNNEVQSLLKKAADLQADLLVTNEGAYVIKPSEELAWKAGLQQFARENSTTIVAGYLILRGKGENFFNRMLVVGADGEILQDYNKQFIPPGEPAEKVKSGILPLQLKDKSVIIGGAICYDFDSMAITKQHGDNRAGLVAVPSSDWRGIDPVHPQMARLRAIEQGYSVARSSRASVSEFYDAYGRARGSLPWFEENDGILVATVPAQPVFTLYKMFGDWFVLLNFLYLLWAGIRFYKRRKALA